jgi:hypothetical protein
MRFLFALLIVASPVAAQPVVHVGDHVRLQRVEAQNRFLVYEGIVQAVGPDSAIVAFTINCGDGSQRAIAYSDLRMRVAGKRLTVPHVIGGAASAFVLGKTLGHVVAHNGGGRDGARAAKYGAALLIPFSALKGYQTRLPKWIPVADQTPRTDHLHVAPEDRFLNQRCRPIRGPTLGNEP